MAEIAEETGARAAGQRQFGVLYTKPIVAYIRSPSHSCGGVEKKISVCDH